MGTFHSICARLLRRYAPRIGYESSFSIYDDADQLAVIKRCYVDAGINPKQFAPQAVRAAISRAKEELLTPLQYARLADGPFETVAATVYRRYQDALQEQNALDFDDLLVLTLRLFEEAPDVLANLQEGFRHVLVDEYQDVNKAQYLLVRALAEKHRNLTIVGDNSQAIYGWRGANVRYILAFEEDFPETRVVRLEQNYRSSKTILAAAQAVERGLRLRRDKTLWTENDQGTPITICHAADEHEEALFVARETERLVSQEGLHYRDVAVMYRTNAQSRALEEAFVRRRLPYQLVGGTRFYERREVKDVLAYLRLLHNPADATSLERVINVPNRGLGEKTLDDLRVWAGRLGIPVVHALRLLRLVEDAEREGREEPARAPAVRPPPEGGPAQLRAPDRRLAGGGHPAGDRGAVRAAHRAHRLPGVPPGRQGRRGALGERQGAGHGGGPVRRAGGRQRADRLPGGGLPDQRRGHGQGRHRSGDPDDPPRGQGPGVPGGLHARHGGGGAAPRPGPGGPGRGGVRRGAAPGLRGHHAGHEHLYLVHCEQRTLFGFTRRNEPSRFLAELPPDHVQWVNSYGVRAGAAGAFGAPPCAPGAAPARPSAGARGPGPGSAPRVLGTVTGQAGLRPPREVRGTSSGVSAPGRQVPEAAPWWRRSTRPGCASGTTATAKGWWWRAASAGGARRRCGCASKTARSGSFWAPWPPWKSSPPDGDGSPPLRPRRGLLRRAGADGQPQHDGLPPRGSL